ncbi:MAG: nitroreductase family protein, partial [Candidatus Delongbacteria bacterium]|nr:nitroreductase family protein [Candidatus Delongbacteria bacterium]
MKVEKAIEKRRSYRGLDPVEITEEMIEKLVWSASLAPSCYNNQPWKFIFVRSKDKLEEMKKAISKGNEWMYDASCLIVVL